MYKFFVLLALGFIMISSCEPAQTTPQNTAEEYAFPDTTKIPENKFGDLVKYGRELMLNTAYYIGPEGIKGSYTGNKMNCTNCHQLAGTKPYAFSLIQSHDRYPQYRSREARVLSLAQRVNNCVMRPHNGKPLPLDGNEMIALLCYFKWINEQQGSHTLNQGAQPLPIQFIPRAADPSKGELLYNAHCTRCHGPNGEGVLTIDKTTYQYPPLWGKSAYQPGSSMHRVIKQAQWIKANMPYDSATWMNPVLTDEEALDIAAFVNDDRIHQRPGPESMDYPIPEEKPIDYGKGPFADAFTEAQHKFGPFTPIIKYWEQHGLKPAY